MYESELYYFSYLVNPFGIILFPIALFRNVFDSLKELATCTSYIYNVQCTSKTFKRKREKCERKLRDGNGFLHVGIRYK